MAPQKAATGKEEVEEVAGPAGPTKITHAAGLLQSDQRAVGIFQQGLSWWGNPRGPIVNQAPQNRGGRGKKRVAEDLQHKAPDFCHCPAGVLPD